MFSNQLPRVKETMGAVANMIPLVASDDGGHPLFTNTRVAHHYDPAWFGTRASWRAFFHM
jgi:hypothetical protein